MNVIEVYSLGYEEDLSREHIASIYVDSQNTERQKGAEFFTDVNEPVQVGVAWYPSGHRIELHKHLPRNRPAFCGQTQEVLIVKKGRIFCRFYDRAERWAMDYVAVTGDVLVIYGGAHSFEILDDAEIVEVHQGPYRAPDKVYLNEESKEQACKPTSD